MDKFPEEKLKYAQNYLVTQMARRGDTYYLNRYDSWVRLSHDQAHNILCQVLDGTYADVEVLLATIPELPADAVIAPTPEQEKHTEVIRARVKIPWYDLAQMLALVLLSNLLAQGSVVIAVGIAILLSVLLHRS